MAEPIIRSEFDLPLLASLPEDIRERLSTVQEKSGFLPNIFVALARRPDEFRAFFAYHDALLEQKHGTLTKADKEMIIVTTSALNDCHYCVIAHGAILRIRSKNPLLSDQVAINYRKADITAAQRAMLDFACAVALRSGSVEDAEIQVLIGLGFSHEDVWDILAITAFFAMSNRLANVASIRPNPEFYALGRG
ncbi:MAG: peroxidase-related enzyme [Gammaproteobacteria bacterium]|nr:peroxidase-related enzyme [Gammaproteobacteria bacterium]